MGRLYDLSPPLDETLTVWPGDLCPERTLRGRIADGKGSNLSSINLSVHAGSHVDAPCHLDPWGADITAVPLEVFVGPCRVVEHLERRNIGAKDIDTLSLTGMTRILFKTLNSEFHNQGEFRGDYIGLLPEAAERLVRTGIRLVGIDYLSVEPGVEQALGVHRILCGAGVIVLETLNLAEVPPGDYELIALPLPIPGSDGSPVRAILRDL